MEDFQTRLVHALRRPLTEEEAFAAGIATRDNDPITEVLRLRARLEEVTRRGILLERQVRADHGGELPASVRDNPPRVGDSEGPHRRLPWGREPLLLGESEASVVAAGGELFAVEVPRAAT